MHQTTEVPYPGQVSLIWIWDQGAHLIFDKVGEDLKCVLRFEKGKPYFTEKLKNLSLPYLNPNSNTSA